MKDLSEALMICLLKKSGVLKTRISLDNFQFKNLRSRSFRNEDFDEISFSNCCCYVLGYEAGIRKIS